MNSAGRNEVQVRKKDNFKEQASLNQTSAVSPGVNANLKKKMIRIALQTG